MNSNAGGYCLLIFILIAIAGAVGVWLVTT
jgi:hypothetical protein